MEEGGVNPWTRHPTPPVQPQQQTAGAFSFGGPELEAETSDVRNRILDEEDICRVCRGEATPEQPLLHPWYSICKR